MPRTPEQIEAELEDAKAWRTETAASLSGLTESIASLRSQHQEDGTSAKLGELSTQLGELKTQLSEAKAAETELRAELKAVAEKQSNSPAVPPNEPRSGGDPLPDPADPPARKTRTGLGWL